MAGTEPPAQLGAPGMPRGHAPVVREHPFTADFRTTVEGRQSITGHICRDSQGRTRVDMSIPPGRDVRVIDDVVASTTFVLDIKAGVYERDTYTRTDIGWYFENFAPIYEEDHQEILGISCVRVRFKPLRSATTVHDFGESWISKSLGIVMTDTNPSQKWRWEIIKIEFREPSPDSFQMPQDAHELQ